MQKWNEITDRRSARLFQGLSLAAAISVFSLVMAGYWMRFSGAAPACPTWLACGSIQLSTVHLVLASLSGLFIIAAIVTGLISKVRGVQLAALAASGAAVLAQAQLGARYDLAAASGWVSPLHLGLALLALGILVTITASAYRTPSSKSTRLAPFARLALAAALSLLVVMVSGVWTSQVEIKSACIGWPLCSGGLPDSSAGWVALAHRFISLLSGGMMLAVFLRAWKSQRSQPLVLSAATAAGVLFAGQSLIGALKVSQGSPLDLVGLHAATSAGVWAAAALTAAAAVLSGRTDAEERAEAAEPRETGKARAKAFLMLNKPIIVALLLVTTYAGMVVGGKQIPSLALTFWVMLGGALAAGGSSALNQYIDRGIDGAMQRTAKRPLPSGRLAPAEALAYGIGACLAAFFLMAGFVNLLSAVLSLAGMIYYVLLYSVWLKKLTVQNIVIGGGAGAIPPLVGWAAATGSLNVPSLFLFALVFLWTPPHFWALALVRQNDYARAGVPMLPVVRGEKATRVQIFVYTLELVALTLIMPIFNAAGSLFLVLAAVLGLWLISAAYRVLRTPGNKVAWKMYRYSSMYLAFIFLALVLDVLL